MMTSDKYIDLEITVEELYNGCEKVIHYKRYSSCPSLCFFGPPCILCSGQGVNLDVPSILNRGSDETIPLILCKECRGTGTLFKKSVQKKGDEKKGDEKKGDEKKGDEKRKGQGNNSNCCDGSGTVILQEEIKVAILPGMYAGETIIFPKMSNVQVGMLTGNVVVKILVKPHPLFICLDKSPDVFYKHYNDIATKDITTLCGHVCRIIDKDILGHYGLWSKDGISRGKLIVLHG
jgi:DnaJ-class molecular chaperone